MKLARAQLVLDTNILVHLLRGKFAAQVIERKYRIGQRTPRAIISVVTKGELKALAYKFEWGLTSENGSIRCWQGCRRPTSRIGRSTMPTPNSTSPA